ncbi:hypothetical protein TNCT_276891 [Trichonephila clavata]|uniref:Uncharacterized protein n=1 Tax=Trichonephila clavata TaxID=2740835 RepID=A0A8X6LL06_TRICU|nr:hypothetical protein TNCT_276891 [Trichonephila clavata]
MEYRTSNPKLSKLVKQMDNLKPSNEEANAVINHNCHASVDDQEAAEALAQQNANEKSHYVDVLRHLKMSAHDSLRDNEFFTAERESNLRSDIV